MSYEMRVSRESHGCSSCALSALSTKILPWSAQQLYWNRFLVASWEIGDRGCVSTVKSFFFFFFLFNLSNNLWKYDTKSLEWPLNRDIFLVWMPQYCRLFVKIELPPKGPQLFMLKFLIHTAYFLSSPTQMVAW